MIYKDIEVGNPELRLFFKLLGLTHIIAIQNFTNKVKLYSYNELKELDELELTVSEFCDLHHCRIYVK